MKPLLEILAVLLCLASALGCRQIGPKTIVDVRLPYNEAISTSWKEQALLNVVRLRYADIPEFVDVASIVNGYERSRSASLGLGTEFYPNNLGFGPFTPDVGASQTLSDRPTITYAPQTGPEFTRNLTSPIPPVAILNLIESGYAADVILDLTVDSINGVRNRGFSDGFQDGDPEFQNILQIMKIAQAAGHLNLRVVTNADKTTSHVVLGLHPEEFSETEAQELDDLRRILHLDPDIHEFKIVFGLLPRAKDEIAFRTRSVYRMLMFLALDVQVPECHLAAGHAPALGSLAEEQHPHFTVQSSCKKPDHCFAAVQYQGYWFWIDQRDFNSKRTMIFLKILLALTDTRQKENSPVLTIRAN